MLGVDAHKIIRKNVERAGTSSLSPLSLLDHIDRGPSIFSYEPNLLGTPLFCEENCYGPKDCPNSGLIAVLA